jgi:hypothetical protein
LLYDVSSSTNPTFLTGREAGEGFDVGAVNTLTLSPDGSVLYLGRTEYSGACTAGTGAGCELLLYNLAADMRGDLVDSNAFDELSVTVGSVRFNDAASTTGTMSMAPNTTATFNAGSTYTFQNINWDGQGSTTPITLQSSQPGSDWFLDVPGSLINVEYVNVQDSDASLTAGGIFAASSTDGGNNTNWYFGAVAPRYELIMIDAGLIDNDLTDFPVYVDLSDLSANFWATTPDGALVGTDIWVTNASDVELPRQLVSASSTMQTGELWFRADAIGSTTDTVFKIWYDGSTDGDYAATDPFGSENVWTNNFGIVYHMNDGLDSTSNSRDRVGLVGAPVATSTAFGEDLTFDGVDDGWEMTNIAYWEAAWSSRVHRVVFTTESDVTTRQTLFAEGGGTKGIMMYIRNGSLYSRWWSESSGWNGNDINTSISASTTYDAAMYFDNGEYALYLNGTFIGSSSVPTTTIDSHTGDGGIAYTNVLKDFDDGDFTGAYFNGTIHEVQTIDVEPGAAWYKAAAANLGLGGDLYAVSAPAWNPTDWTLYDTITIKHENIDASLTDFPVYVDLSDLSSQFWSTTPATSALVGTDIRVTNAANQELPRELVFASSTAETGELHFKADFINKDIDTSFKIWYNGSTNGDYATAATFGAENVWTNNYAAVWHPENNGGDSTQYGNSVTANGNATVSSGGKLGSAFVFDGTGDYYSVATLPELAGLDAYTISAWSYLNTIGTTDNADDGAIFTYGQGGDNTDLLWFNVNHIGASDSVRAYSFNAGPTAGSTDRVNAVTTPTAAEWHFVTAVRDGTTRRAYYNGAQDGVATTATAAVNEAVAEARIGSWGNAATFDFDGRIDSVRVATITRSASWIKAEYLNQSTTTDFYFLGAGSSGTGSTTLSGHDAGQVDNAFSSQNVTDEELFAFKLTPESGTSTITELTLTVSGAQNIDVADFSNLRLLRDLDADGEYDVTDELITTGTLSLGNRGRSTNSAQLGTIIFNTPFLSTTTMNYFVVADWDAPERGSFLMLTLDPEDIIATDGNGGHAILGGVDHIQHNRNNRGGGGSSARVGTPAPAGDGEVSGGGADAGEQIGDDPNYRWPTADTGSWSNGANAYDQVDGTYANTNGAGGIAHQFTTFNDSVPGTDVIEGIQVKLETRSSDVIPNLDIQLSWDGGISWTTAKSTDYPAGDVDTIYDFGSPSDTWGRSWSPGEFSNENFRVRVTATNADGGTTRIDAIQVRIYHQATGGGSGGGARI